MTIAAGTRLGPYEIVSTIGAGGMGEVYRARDPRLGREVAIKVLPASFSADPDRLRRFEQEARAAGVLNHPNLTAVLDIGEHEGAPYVVQELLEGETLRSALAGGRLPPRRAIDYAIQTARGLAAAHEKGIVHRDLKPENVFVTKDGRIKILDFGLAKLTHAEEGSAVTNVPTATAGTEPGVVLGTLGYMSPEQVRGRPADARSDIFSFGAILYEMLSGQRAFRGDSAADTMSAVLREDPPDLSVTNQNVSPAVERIVRHCLEKNPEQRFHSAHDLAFDLETLSGVSTPLQTPPRPARRRFPVASASAAAALLLFGAAAGWIAGTKRAGRHGGEPVFQRQTFRRGHIDSARFAPDGQTIVYSAAWDGHPTELFSSRVGSTESRTLSLPSANVLSISATGEMAVNLKRPSDVPDMLARVSLAGGAPREILPRVLDCDWTPDGKDLAIIRRISGTERTLEMPIGKVLLRSPTLLAVRVSPDGTRMAVFEDTAVGDTLMVVDRSGQKRVLSTGFGGPGLAWSPDGREIWFTEASKDGPPQLYAVDLTGRKRIVLKAPSWLWIYDIARDGRLLMGNNGWRAGVNWVRAGDPIEHDVSWLDWGVVADLSADGRALLFSEQREGGHPVGAVFLRTDPAQPPVRLGDGAGLALSPDGQWALAAVPALNDGPWRLMLLPTGAGESKELPMPALHSYGFARWLPDGKRFLVRAETGGKSRVYLGDVAGSAPRPVTPEGISNRFAVSPDGRQFAATRVGEKIEIFPTEGGEPRVVSSAEPGEVVLQWSSDGRFLYVFAAGAPSAKIMRVELATGARELWKEIAPSDPAGVEVVWPIVMTSDARSWVYTYRRRTSDLYVVGGLR